MAIKVISGLHKGKVGKIIKETPITYMLDINGKEEIIVIKSRCENTYGVVKSLHENSSKVKSKITNIVTLGGILG